MYMAGRKKAVNSKANTESAGTLLIVKEGSLIAMLAIAMFCLFALFSYNAQDPGWSAIGDQVNVVNAMGSTGAWLSDLFFSLFGFSAYIIPAMLLYRGWLIFRDRYTPLTFDSVTVGMKVTGALLLVLGLTCLFSLSSAPNHEALPFGAGGIIGRSMQDGLVPLISPSGTVLVMLALTLFGLTLFAEVSWLAVMDRVGALALVWSATTINWFSDWRERRAEIARQRRRDKEMQQATGIHTQKLEADTAEKGINVLTKVVDQVKQTTSLVLPKETEELKEGAANALYARQKNETKQVKVKPKKILTNNPSQMSIPEFELLDTPDLDEYSGYSKEELNDFSELLETKLADFGITAQVKSVLPGPVITRFEIQPAAGVKVSRISNLVKDLARSLAVVSVRVVEVIPGKSFVGIEIPNANRAVVYLSDVLFSDTYQQAESPLTLALGHDIAGEPIVADLAKMPHLLVAGTTGSGKSVGVNAMLLSLLYKATPAEVRMILIDPKMLELNVYEGIPHLLAPVITDMKDAANGLRWCVAEMERRYRLMAAMGVRNLAGFNKKIQAAIDQKEPITDPTWQPDPLSIVDVEDQIPPDLTTLPNIVVVIDEFADMMMIVGKKVEQLIARIAQKARAAGIHLVLATQRPSVDVITGLIKANVPTRIGFQVSSRIDSRTILDQGGAEQLLGHGDMLYLPPGSGVPVRVHGAFVSDEEVHRVCDDWRSRSEPDYIPDVTEGTSSGDMGAAANLSEESDDESDPLYDEAVHFVTKTRKASISGVQRKLRIGYNRAARMIETMEAAGVVSEMQTNGSREVLAPEPVNA